MQQRTTSIKKTDYDSRRNDREKQSELDEIVADAFGMKDNVYFKYAIEVMIPMIAGNTDIGIERTEENEMYGRYAKIFYDYFADIYEEQKSLCILSYIQI